MLGYATAGKRPDRLSYGKERECNGSTAPRTDSDPLRYGIAEYSEGIEEQGGVRYGLELKDVLSHGKVKNGNET